MLGGRAAAEAVIERARVAGGAAVGDHHRPPVAGLRARMIQ
jgi:hypothetical protein